MKMEGCRGNGRKEESYRDIVRQGGGRLTAVLFLISIMISCTEYCLQQLYLLEVISLATVAPRYSCNYPVSTFLMSGVSVVTENI